VDERLRWLDGLHLPPSHLASFQGSLLEDRPLDTVVRSRLRRSGGWEARRERAREILRRATAADGEVLVPTDSRFPAALRDLPQPPCALFVRGDPALLEPSRSVAVIGARRASPWARTEAERLGGALARAGRAVVSGLARGVDGSSHRGCLAAGGRPVAVLGTALDQVYPAEHAALQEAVARAGCLVTERPPGDRVRPWHFVGRNRLLAALALALVVVEAGEGSGTLSTVEFAAQGGATVLVYPGAAADPRAAGCLALLRQGAGLVRRPEDVLEDLGLADEAREEAAPLGLGAAPRSAAELASGLRLPLPRVLQELARLEVEGRVRRVEGGRWVAVPWSRGGENPPCPRRAGRSKVPPTPS
jgi:DNA processing protein